MDRATSIAAMRLNGIKSAAKRLEKWASNLKLRAQAGNHPTIQQLRSLTTFAETAASLVYELADDVGRGVEPPPAVVIANDRHKRTW